MRRYKWTGSFDLVIASASLHLVRRRSWQKLLARIREYTKPGGYVLISVFTGVIPPHEEIKDVVVGAFHKGELFRQFPNWDTLVKESYVKREKHPGVRWHRHSVDKLLVQKPVWLHNCPTCPEG
jgi:SAM-dependent methyltransferase